MICVLAPTIYLCTFRRYEHIHIPIRIDKGIKRYKRYWKFRVDSSISLADIKTSQTGALDSPPPMGCGLNMSHDLSIVKLILVTFYYLTCDLSPGLTWYQWRYLSNYKSDKLVRIDGFWPNVFLIGDIARLPECKRQFFHLTGTVTFIANCNEFNEIVLFDSSHAGTSNFVWILKISPVAINK